MRILITNDDGFYAQGIKELKSVLQDDYDVYVVAPDRERSATSHSLTLDYPLRINKKSEKEFTVDGTPTDCVLVAIHGLMEHNPPELVISGINHGPNMGEDVTYSGTVAAAFEGTILGIRSVSVSVMGLEQGTLLNVNVPNLPPHEIKGIAITRLGKVIHLSGKG